MARWWPSSNVTSCIPAFRSQATLTARRVDHLNDPVEDVAVIAFATRVPGACEREAKKMVRACLVSVTRASYTPDNVLHAYD